MPDPLDRLRGLLADPPTGLPVNVSTPERVLTALAGAALVGVGLARRRPRPLLTAAGTGLLARSATGYCPAYAATGTDTTVRPSAAAIEAMTINRPRAEVFAAWRRLDTLAAVMDHVEAVEDLGDGRTRWTAKGPLGVGTATWIAQETVHDAPNELGWRTVEGDLDHAGRVRFADSPQGGTEVRVEWRYLLPEGGGPARGLLTPAFETMLRHDLRRFRAFVEAGEVPTTDGQPKGPWRPGRPTVFVTSPV